MTVEILFSEVCGLYGDKQNADYLKKCLPEAEFIYTDLLSEPYFINNTPDIIYIGTMSENIQRRVIGKLSPFTDRINELIDGGTVILATGNAPEIFCEKIEYITEKTEINGLCVFPLTVKNDLFRRYNGKTLGVCDNIKVVGFRSQFSFIYGDNSSYPFLEMTRGIGINPESRFEGMRKNNFFCTSILGPLLPLNPLFTEYLISLTGEKAEAAFRNAAMDAYNQRIKEFEDPKVKF